MELKSGDLLFYKKFLWEVKNQRVNKGRKNREDESKRKKILNCL